MHSSTILIAVAVVLAVLILLLIVVRSRRQHVALDATAPTPLARTASPAAPQVPPPAPAPPPTPLPPEGHGVGDEVTAAVENVIDQFVGLSSHPSVPVAPVGDQLTMLKGLGPRAAARLDELGVTSFAQIAAWDETDVAAIDAQMGAFRGRITRDRWVEQAQLLAVGDQAGFETQFGKLGG